MTVEEIISEIEKIDGNVEKNTEIKFVYGLIARGVWQIALQIAEANNPLYLDDTTGLWKRLKVVEKAQ